MLRGELCPVCAVCVCEWVSEWVSEGGIEWVSVWGKDCGCAVQVLVEDFATCGGHKFLFDYLLYLERKRTDDAWEAIHNMVFLISGLVTAGFSPGWYCNYTKYIYTCMYVHTLYFGLCMYVHIYMYIWEPTHCTLVVFDSATMLSRCKVLFIEVYVFTFFYIATNFFTYQLVVVWHNWVWVPTKFSLSPNPFHRPQILFVARFPS